MIMSHYFLNRWKPGQKCALIEFSSVGAYKFSGLLPVYVGSKAFNMIFVRSLMQQYQNVDFLAVYPSSVRSNMNPGMFPNTITAQ